MKNERCHELFDETFRFTCDSEVRHRADSKEYSADMGLFVIARMLVEKADDDGNPIFERNYYCRMAIYSGSGQVQIFSEKELMSVREYEEKKLQDKEERDRMRSEIEARRTEVFKLFGVTRGDYLRAHEKDSAKYRVSGFSSTDGVVKLLCQEVLESLDNKKTMSREFSTPDEFTVMTDINPKTD